MITGGSRRGKVDFSNEKIYLPRQFLTPLAVRPQTMKSRWACVDWGERSDAQHELFV